MIVVSNSSPLISLSAIDSAGLKPLGLGFDSLGRWEFWSKPRARSSTRGQACAGRTKYPRGPPHECRAPRAYSRKRENRGISLPGLQRIHASTVAHIAVKSLI